MKPLIILLLIALSLTGCAAAPQTGTLPPVTNTPSATEIPPSPSPAPGLPETTRGIVTLEGMDEEVNLKLGGSQGYTLYYDVDRYDYEASGHSDLYYAKGEIPGDADVFLLIERHEGMTKAQALEQDFPKGNVPKDYPTPYAFGVDQVEGDFYYTVSDDTGLATALLLYERDGALYRVTIRYPVDYAEGHGARLFATLQSIVFE